MPKITAPKKLKITIALDALVLNALDHAVSKIHGISRSEYVNQTLAMALIDKGHIVTIDNQNSSGSVDLQHAADTLDGGDCHISPPSPSPAHADSCFERERARRARVRIEES